MPARPRAPWVRAGTRARLAAVLAAVAGVGASAPAVAQERPATFFLRGTGQTSDPATLWLDPTAPAGAAKRQDSPPVRLAGGNPWQRVGTWTGPAGHAGRLTAVPAVHLWLGLQRGADAGTPFDLRVEVRQHGTTLVGAQERSCVQGLAQNPNGATEVVLTAVPTTATAVDAADTLAFTVLTRLGTTGAGQPCGGRRAAAGVRLYFDAPDRPSRFSATVTTAPLAPTLSALDPPAGPVGQAVTLTGTAFGDAPGTSTVTFNGVLATPLSWSATAITTTVPGGATTGPVVVTVHGAASPGLPFSVGSPRDPPTAAHAGCAGSPGLLYAQNWARGAAPVAMPNGGYYQSTRWGGSQPVDPRYPDIASSEAVTVRAGAGPAGEAVLDRHPQADYVIAGVVLGDFGPIADGAGPRWWDAAEGCLSVQYLWTALAWDQAFYTPLLAVGRGLSFGDLGFALDANILGATPGTQGALTLGYAIDQPGAPRWRTVRTHTFTRAATVDRWHTFEVRWKAASPSGATAADGWLRVVWNGQIIYDLPNLPLQLASGAGTPGGRPNLLRTVWLGYDGLFGPTTNLLLANPATGPPVGDPGTDPGGTAAYYHADGLGSVRLITNASGAEVTRFDFLPFGQEPGASPHPNTIRFTGKERDPETAASATGWAALDYFGARYYQSQTGRFTSVDPVFTWEENLVDPQRWNRYAYVRNNPFRYVDPDGRAIETLWDAFNIGTGLASLVANVSAGNVPGAALDVVGLLADAGATAVPGLPGGAGSAIKAWRVAENAKMGRTFEQGVLETLGAAKNHGGVSEIATRITTIPDLPVGTRFGVTEVKNVQNLSFSKQLQAQLSAAQTAKLPYNLIVSTRTRHVSETVRAAIRQTKGKIFVYDDKMRAFSDALFDDHGNLVR